jgi:hypothetical protein
MFTGNVDTSGGSLNSFCWSIDSGSTDGYGTLWPTLDTPLSCATFLPLGSPPPNSYCSTTAPPAPPSPPGAPVTGPTAPTTGPVAPAAPTTGPVAPAAPTTGPVSPAAPHAPTTGPVAPHAPVPTGPVAPVAPIAPVAPVSTATEKLVCASLLVVSLAALVL